jgi:hypothetical protein
MKLLLGGFGAVLLVACGGASPSEVTARLQGTGGESATYVGTGGSPARLGAGDASTSSGGATWPPGGYSSGGDHGAGGDVVEAGGSQGSGGAATGGTIGNGGAIAGTGGVVGTGGAGGSGGTVAAPTLYPSFIYFATCPVLDNSCPPPKSWPPGFSCDYVGMVNAAAGPPAYGDDRNGWLKCWKSPCPPTGQLPACGETGWWGNTLVQWNADSNSDGGLGYYSCGFDASRFVQKRQICCESGGVNCR